MLIQTRSMVIEKGNSEKVLERFSGPTPVVDMPGLIDFSVMVNKKSKEHEEVMVIIRWESEEAWKNWEKSDAHLQGHRNKRGQEKPAYLISTTVNMYEVQTVKTGKGTVQQ
ncbi:antibiotic biosynthesis monooxygenase [Paenibacillus xylanilyticus]|uniref:Antibiotic biosynthesis monooxygenase n=1 Tax=Paenibacillus xylanilyticus TaxID=248903 RepID=A0A7Y6BXL7_9BACL|nr:antibiotic biosynthesis monooxygenase [Paenibacillus xylanilyticus]NUU76857.1 antibiotic biosynthesis monooxygenase [Paenibacillus xylanilyticus]